MFWGFWPVSEFMVILFIIWIAIFIWALIDMLKASKESGWKILWFIVIVLLPLLGVILYYFIGMEQGRKRKRKGR
ncbi:MAG: PLD nuclease N-terminal domain-containing protein [Candidatus Aenigmatarchaeota archaeon]